MKDIRENLEQRRSFREFIESAQIDEGLKDLFLIVKEKFKQAWQYVNKIVVKLGNYYVVPVDNEGNPEPVILPATAALAYKSGAAGSKAGTFVHPGKNDVAICGFSNNVSAVLQLPIYAKYEDKAAYFASLKPVRESEESETEAVNEVQLDGGDPNGYTVCDSQELQDIILDAWEDRQDEGRLLIWGAPGIGKTAIIKNVIEVIKKKGNPNARLITKSLAVEKSDSFFLPDYVVGEHGEKVGATDVMKTWLPMYKVDADPKVNKERDAMLGAGILFLDELSRADASAKQVILPIINEGEFEGYKLGSNWCIICASNRLEDDPDSPFTMSAALMNRFEHIYYNPTYKTWRDWAAKQSFISPLLLQWLDMPESENMSGRKYWYYDQNPELQAADADKRTVVYCTPRSWTMAMKKLANVAHRSVLNDADLSDFGAILKIYNVAPQVIERCLAPFVTRAAVDGFMGFLGLINKVGDVDRFCDAVWHRNGAGVRIDKKSAQLVYMSLAQVIITSHADKLPASDEMTSLAKFIATQEDTLGSYVTDIFNHTFFGEIADNQSYIEIAYNMPAMLKYFASGTTAAEKSKRESIKSHVEQKFASILKRYGISSLEEFPDYSEFTKVLGKAFDFSKMNFDGKDIF
jgi:hypothetical protein